MASAVTVAVRCRPLSPKELKEKSKPIISMEGATTTIKDPAGKTKPLSFNFDHSFWSGNPSDPHFQTQEDVYGHLGGALLDNAFAGYNGCLFAYGQTGSGKTYSMLGYGEEKGIIPQLCDNLFLRCKEKASGGTWNCQVSVSYLEIYMEKCKCLLSPNQGKQNYRVREHPVTGPYVENLTKIVVHSFEEIERIMEEGNKLRTVAATQMNATSSRSHAIFTVTFTQKTTHEQLNATSEMSSRINLVDLAGSERADRTGASGDTLKEGSNINKSLTTLGKVINGLADVGKDGKPKKHVPFRDSSLTWLLKDNLCGNSKTIMIAALSPADTNYEETVSTLRYADRAKSLKTQAVKNEDPSSKKIRELQEEVDRLQMQLAEVAAKEAEREASKSPRAGAVHADEIDYEHMSAKDKIEIAKKLLAEESMTWEDNETQSSEVQELRTKLVQQQGIGIPVSKDACSFVNLNEDPLMNGCLLYQLQIGVTRIGTDVEDITKDIKLTGEGIKEDHAIVSIFEPMDEESGHDASIAPADPTAEIFVNGSKITEVTPIHHGDRVIVGSVHVFRFSDPKAPRASLVTTQAGSPGHVAGGSAATAAMDFQTAMEEKFKTDIMKATNESSDGAVKLSQSFVVMKEEKRIEQEMKLADMEKKLGELEQSQRNNLSHKFLMPISVSQASPSPPRQDHVDPMASSTRGAQSKQSSLVTVANLAAGTRQNRLPNKIIFRQKVVLLGHQEVGKTSLRKCFESDPMFGFFGKKLPEVKSTTGIEHQLRTCKVNDENVELNISDFAGQEAYHSHTLFLTERSIFALVWKISAVEQDFQSAGISEHEEIRICRWVAEVYAKFPNATLAIVATHLDELRDQSQRAVEFILKKVQTIVERYMERIARTDDEGKPMLLPILGSFAATCKNRTFIGAGEHGKLSGQKMSALLSVMATKAHDLCQADPVFWGGAIPGRHIRLMHELEEKKNNKWLMPLSEYVHMAVQFGIESDNELLQVSQLMHSWNTIYLFNTRNIAENVFIFLHPGWLCKMAGNLFSFSHVINTPMHLRSIIGGLDYTVSLALEADAGLMCKGFLRLPLVKVIFNKVISTFMKKEPEEADYETCLQLLMALELMYKVDVTCDDDVMWLQETPPSQRNPKTNVVSRYFIPSLSPFKVPVDLRSIVPLLFDKGVRVKMDFNFLPSEFWWRLQFRLHPHLNDITVHCPRFRTESEEDDEETEIKGAEDVHNRWIDACYLHGEHTRAILMREGEKSMWLYCFETEEGAAQKLLHETEEAISGLLGEYQGLQREVTILNPEERVTFGPKKHAEVIEAFSCALDASAIKSICTFFGVSAETMEEAALGEENEGNMSSPTEDCPEMELDPCTALDRMVRAMLLKQQWASQERQREAAAAEENYYY